MLKRAPKTQRAGDPQLTSATSGGFGIIVSKPFKTPTPLAPRRDSNLPARKRKAVSYKEDGGGGDDGNDGYTDDGANKKSKYAMGNKEYGEDGVLGGMGKWCNRKFPVFAPKERDGVFKQK